MRCELAAGQHEVLSASEGPCVFIVTRGRGRVEVEAEAEGKGWETEKGLEIHMAVVA